MKKQWTYIRRPKKPESPCLDGGIYGVQAGKFKIQLHWSGTATTASMNRLFARIKSIPKMEREIRRLRGLSFRGTSK